MIPVSDEDSRPVRDKVQLGVQMVRLDARIKVDCGADRTATLCLASSDPANVVYRIYNGYVQCPQSQGGSKLRTTDPQVSLALVVDRDFEWSDFVDLLSNELGW